MTAIRWETGERLSPLHAARCWAAGIPAIDAAVARAIADPVSRLTERLAAAEVDLAIFWRRLVAASAALGSGPAAGSGAAAGLAGHDLEACRIALTASGVGELALDGIASAAGSLLAETRLAYQEHFPKLPQQLPLRGRPLREQWEAYGPGLLRRTGVLTHESFIPRSVNVLWLSPYRGGDGDCDPPSRTLWVEAVLTNPVPTVPEVLRLAWLIARVGATAKMLPTPPTDHHGGESFRRSAEVLSLALLPVVLEAAAYLELVPSPGESPELIAAAIEAWNGPTAATLPQTLAGWWAQTCELKPAFPIALKALDKMLEGQPNGASGRSAGESP